MQKISKLFQTAIAVAILCTATFQLHSTSYTWQGTAISEDMTVPVNWTPAGPPTLNTDIAQFSNTATGQAPFLNGTNLTCGLFTFLSGSPGYAFSLTGVGATLNLGGSSTSSGVQNLSSNIQTFNINQNAIVLFNGNSSTDIGSTGLVTYDLGNVSTPGSLTFGGNTAGGASTFNLTSGSVLSMLNFSTGGAGTIINLTGGSTFNADHSVTIGALTVTDTASIVQIGGTLTLGTAGNQIIGGTVENSGSPGAINKVGSGTLTFTGTANLTYTGGTTVRGGTSTFINVLPPSSGGINLLNNSAVDLEITSGSETYSGPITGIGNLLINETSGNNGTVVLTGLTGIANYNGFTGVGNGTLSIQNSTDTTLSGPIVVALGAVIDFEQNAATTGSYSNIFGGGSVTVNAIPGNTGTVILGGINNYTGGTTVSKGILQGDTNSLQGFITDNATLNFKQLSSGTFNGVLAGSGVINLIGSGTVLFNTDNNLFTGTTNVLNGSLGLTNALGGNVIAQTAGVLFGTGTVLGNVTIDNGGSILPGSTGTAGILNVKGNYVQNSGSTYQVQMQGIQASSIDVAGSAILNAGSTVNISGSSSGILVDEPYTILTANGGLSGTFSSVTSSNSLLHPIVTYDGNHVFIEFQIQFFVVTATSNQRHVLQQLQAITNPTPQQEAILQQLILLPTAEAQKSLDQMSAQQYTNLLLTAEISNRQFIRRLYDPLRAIITSDPCTLKSCSCDDRPIIDVWAEASGGASIFQGNKNARGVRIGDYELTIGAQTMLTDSWILGTAASYEKDYINYNIGGSSRSHLGLGAIYGLYRPEKYYILADLVGGYRNETMKRHINVGNIHLAAFGKPKIFHGTFYIEAGKDYFCNSMLIQPFVGFETGYYQHNRINECGASPLNVTVFSRSHYLSYSRLGVHLTTKTLPSDFSVNLDLAWQYRITSQGDNLREHFKGFGGPFEIVGLGVQRNSLEASMCIIQGLGCGWELFAEMYGQSWQRAFSYNFIGGIKKNW